MGYFIYIGSDGKKRGRKPLKPKTVDCEVIDAPQGRTVADLMLNPTPKEEAEQKQKQFDEQMAYLRKNDPKMAKKVWRNYLLFNLLGFAIFIGICLAVVFLRNIGIHF